MLLLMLPLATLAQDSVDNKFTYKLYPTKNMWTFLKLNTADGTILQVQYDVDCNNRFEVYINFELVYGSDVKNGRFELYPT